MNFTKIMGKGLIYSGTLKYNFHQFRTPQRNFRPVENYPQSEKIVLRLKFNCLKFNAAFYGEIIKFRMTFLHCNYGFSLLAKK